MWLGQVKDGPRLGAGNLSFSCSPRPGLGAWGDRPVVAGSRSSRMRLEAVAQAEPPAVNPVRFGCQQLLVDFVKYVVQVVPSTMPPPQIHQLVARDGDGPRANRQRCIPNATLQMQGQQCPLNQVLHLIGQVRKAALQKGTQSRRQRAQRLPVGRVITRRRTQPQRIEADSKSPRLSSTGISSPGGLW